MAKAIGTLGTIPQIDIAGRLIPNPVRSASPAAGDTIILRTVTANNALAAQTYGSLRIQGQDTGYQVPAGLSLRIIAVRITSLVAAEARHDIGYADNDPSSGTDPYHGSAPTNPVYASSGNTISYVSLTTTAAIGAEKEFLMDFVVPTGKYLQVAQAAGTGAVVAEVIGILE